MKKKWKIFWIACAVSGGIGVVLLIISFAMGVTFQKVESMMPNGISIGKFEEGTASDKYADVSEEEIKNDDSYLADMHDIYEGITALDIELTAGEVEILTSENDQVEIETEGISKKLKLSYYIEGNTLIVDSAKELKNIVNHSLGTIYIYLPNKIRLEEAQISIGAGTLYIEDIVVNNFSVEVGAGEADIDSFVAREAEFECGAGEMRICGLVDKELDIDCGMGKVSYNTNDSEENYNYKFECGVGEITCGSNRYSGIGSEQKVDNHARKEMDISCGIGKVIVEFEEDMNEHFNEHHDE